MDHIVKKNWVTALGGRGWYAVCHAITKELEEVSVLRIQAYDDSSNKLTSVYLISNASDNLTTDIIRHSF